MIEPEKDQQAAVGEASARAVAEYAEHKLAILIREQATIVTQIQEIKRALLGLSAMFGKNVLSENIRRVLNHRSPTAKRGLTHACRQVILQAEGPLRAAEICQRLTRIAPGVLDNHKMPIASVTTIMQRLCAYGEARAVVTLSGQRAWESSGTGSDGRTTE